MIDDRPVTAAVAQHHCPAKRGGLRTLRVRDLADLKALDLSGLGQRYADAIRERVADSERHIVEHNLCPACGYPLDNSYPHPDEA